MSSYYVGFFEISAEAAEAFRAALISELDWTLDEDGERVWCDADGSLGLKITVSNSSLSGYCCSEHFIPSSACLNMAVQKTDLYLDYAVSKAGSALIVGCHSGGDPAFRGGSVIFAETILGEKKRAVYIFKFAVHFESEVNGDSFQNLQHICERRLYLSIQASVVFRRAVQGGIRRVRLPTDGSQYQVLY